MAQFVTIGYYRRLRRPGRGRCQAQLEQRRLALEERRLALDSDRLKLDRQKASLELRLRRRELDASKGKRWKELLTNPLMLAVAGGFLTLMTTIIINYFNTSNTIAAEAAKAREALQADLIKKFVESPKLETVSATRCCCTT
jgi:hypothetical protein